MTAPSTVVLVHGAMHTPWVWEPFIEELNRALPDVRTDAVQLPSSAPHPGECAGLVEDAAVVRDAIAAAPGPVAVVAHSYGGLPASWAAALAPDDVTDLIYVAAFALEKGSSMMGWMGGSFPSGWTESADGLAVRVDDPASSIYSGVDPDLTAAAVARLNWQGIRSFTDVLGVQPSDALRRTYVVASEDPALPPAVQREWALRMDASIEVASGHSPHLSHPTEVAELIRSAIDTRDLSAS